MRERVGRPVFATNDLGVKVWEGEARLGEASSGRLAAPNELPFGGVQTATGGIDLRFPDQSFESENGLHQNWMRDYDPTTGRYIQADPLGLVDGASVYGYALQNPGRYSDFWGLEIKGRNAGAPDGFHRRRNERSKDGDPFLNGVGSYFRGLYRCAKYCTQDENISTQGEVVEMYRNDDNFRKCVNLAVSDYMSVSDNRSHMLGRGLTGLGMSVLLKNAKGRSGGAAGLGMSIAAFEGDASYAVAQGQSAAQAISSFITGDPNALAEEKICECIEKYGGEK